MSKWVPLSTTPTKYDSAPERQGGKGGNRAQIRKVAWVARNGTQQPQEPEGSVVSSDTQKKRRDAKRPSTSIRASTDSSATDNVGGKGNDWWAAKEWSNDWGEWDAEGDGDASEWSSYVTVKDKSVRVELSRAELGDQDLKALAHYLDIILNRMTNWTKDAHDMYVLNIDLSMNSYITDHGVSQHLAPLLQRWPNVHRLKLFKNCLGAESIRALAPWVARGFCRELHLSDLLGPQVTTEAVMYMLKLILEKRNYPTGRANNTPLWLRLEHNGLRGTTEILDNLTNKGLNVCLKGEHCKPHKCDKQHTPPHVHLVQFHHQSLDHGSRSSIIVEGGKHSGSPTSPSNARMERAGDWDETEWKEEWRGTDWGEQHWPEWNLWDSGAGNRRGDDYDYDDDNVEDSASNVQSDMGDGGPQRPKASQKQKTLYDPKCGASSGQASAGQASAGSPTSKSKRKEVPLTAADLMMGCASYGKMGLASTKKGTIAASPCVSTRDVIVGKQRGPKNVLETHAFPTLGAPEPRLTNLNVLTSQAAWGAAPSAVFEKKPIGPKKKEQPFSLPTASLEWPSVAVPSSSSENLTGFSLPPPANAPQSSSTQPPVSAQSSERDTSWPNPTTATVRPVLPPPASLTGNATGKSDRGIGLPIPSSSILPPPALPPPLPPTGAPPPLPKERKSEEELAQLEIRPLSFAEKEILKTYRKIRDIDKIEEAIANEEKVEKNQLAKVQKKSEIAGKLRELEHRSRAQGGRTLLELQKDEKTLKLIEERNRKLEEQRAAITTVQVQARVWLARREAVRKAEERKLRLMQEEEEKKRKEAEDGRQRILKLEEEERQRLQKIEDERKRKEEEEIQRKRKLDEEERERKRKIAEEEAGRKRVEAEATRRRLEAERQRVEAERQRVEAGKQAERKRTEEQRKAKEREEQRRVVEQLEKQQREAQENAFEAERLRRQHLALHDAEVAERRRVRQIVEGLPMDQWFYITPRGSIEGPFDLEHMRAWRNQGYFQKNLMVSINWYHKFYPLHTIFSDWGRCFDVTPAHPEQELAYIIPLVQAGRPLVFPKSSKEKADMAPIRSPLAAHAQPRTSLLRVAEKTQGEDHKVDDIATAGLHLGEDKPKSKKKQDIADIIAAKVAASEATGAAKIEEVPSVDARKNAPTTSAEGATQQSSASAAYVAEVKPVAKLQPNAPPVPNFAPPTPGDAAPAAAAAAKDESQASPSAPSPRPAPAMPDFPPPEPTSAQKPSQPATEADPRLHDSSAGVDVKAPAQPSESVPRVPGKVLPAPVPPMPKEKPEAPAPPSPKLPPSKPVLPPPKATTPATAPAAPKTTSSSKKKTKDDYVIPAPPLTTCPPPPKDLETGWHSPHSPSPPPSAVSPPPSTAATREAAAKPTPPTRSHPVAEGPESAAATFLKRAGLDTAAVEKAAADAHAAADAAADAATAHAAASSVAAGAEGAAAATPILPPPKEKSRKTEKHASKCEDDDAPFKEQRKKEKKAKKEGKEGKEEKMERKESGMAQATKEAKRIRDQQLEEEREKDKEAESGFNDGEIMHEVQALEQRFVGLIIGKAGDTIKSFKKATGCSIEIDQNLPEGMPRVIIYRGARKQIAAAKKLVEQLLQKTKDDEKSRDSGKLDSDGLPWRRDHVRSLKKSNSKDDGPPVFGSLTGATESLGRPAWMSRRSTPEEELTRLSMSARSPKHISDPHYQTYARNLMLAWRQKIMKGRAYEIPEMMVSLSTMPRPKMVEETKDHKADRSASKVDKVDASPKKGPDPAS
eukprot:GEMP01000169.1.p1 GENE.GEMP01000169.1~~GEMP01000169.1.p1  ORF type:complete len:1767 (+),score=556.41 GEMP01000169.1:1918-7218(+)